MDTLSAIPQPAAQHRQAPLPRSNAPQHRPAPKKSSVAHRNPPKFSKPNKEWVDYWATSTWPNWTPARPNAPSGNVEYNDHEAARAGIRLMPDQGSLIAGLKSRIAQLEARQVQLDSVLRLKSEAKMLRLECPRGRTTLS